MTALTPLLLLHLLLLVMEGLQAKEGLAHQGGAWAGVCRCVSGLFLFLLIGIAPLPKGLLDA